MKAESRFTSKNGVLTFEASDEPKGRQIKEHP